MEINNTKDRELLLTRTLDAPIELVWEIFSTPEHIAKWWGPDGFTNTITVMDLRLGGKWNLTMHGPDGTDYDNKSIYKEIVPLEKIVFEHEAPHIIFTIMFQAQGDQTLLTWHMVFDTAEEFIDVVKKHGAAEGLKQNIAKLVVYLEAQK